jgi:hypoxanthine phosphoribosyltransferase
MAKIKPLFTAGRIHSSIARLGKEISRDFGRKHVDIVAIMDNSILFAADLIREIRCPTTCHFVRAEIRDVEVGGYARKEIFFSPEPYLKGKDVLLVDAVLHTGVTLDFWAKRLLESRPRSLRIAVLVNKPRDRRVDLRPDYFCFESASKHMVGYGLPGTRGEFRNLPYVGISSSNGSGSKGARKKKRASR